MVLGAPAVVPQAARASTDVDSSGLSVAQKYPINTLGDANNPCLEVCLLCCVSCGYCRKRLLRAPLATGPNSERALDSLIIGIPS